MAGKVTRWTLARPHAVIPVESFRTNLVTAVTHPTGIANALSIVLPTASVVLTVTFLTTVGTVESIRTNLLTIGSSPPGWTLAQPSFMGTFPTILTGAVQPTFDSVRTERTRVLTGGPDVTRPAGVLPGDVVAGRISRSLRVRAPFHATVTEESLRTGIVTGRSGPASGADTIASDRIARRIVVAGADFIARFAVVTQRAAAFTTDTTPVCLANAFSGGRIAR